MEIIVIKHYHGLGKPGDIKDVATGYAQNFLIPKGVVVPATPANRAHWRATADHAAKVQRQGVRVARQAAKQLNGRTLTIVAPANSKGTFFAAVPLTAIVTALAAEDITVTAEQLQVAEPIKQVGVHTVAYTLINGDHGSFLVHVMAQQ